MVKPINLILDTDIGSDIDDSWALTMILKSPEIDLKLVTVTAYDTVYQAKLACKMLENAGRSDVPVGVGIPDEKYKNNYLEDWIGEYDLHSYPNLRENAADAIIDTVMNSDGDIVILGIGNFNNFAEAYEKRPEISKKCKVVALAGNIYNTAFQGWCPPLASEWNIRCNLDSWRRGIENTDFDVELVPLDVSGNIKLNREQMDKVRECAKTDKVLRCLVDSYDEWVIKCQWPDTNGGTSPLFDTVGVYACLTRDNFDTVKLPVYANDESITYIDPERGKLMDIDINWKDKDKFYKFLVARLCGEI